VQHSGAGACRDDRLKTRRRIDRGRRATVGGGTEKPASKSRQSEITGEGSRVNLGRGSAKGLHMVDDYSEKYGEDTEEG
jgi:hypothetical protein